MENLNFITRLFSPNFIVMVLLGACAHNFPKVEAPPEQRFVDYLRTNHLGSEIHPPQSLGDPEAGTPELIANPAEKLNRFYKLYAAKLPQDRKFSWYAIRLPSESIVDTTSQVEEFYNKYVIKVMASAPSTESFYFRPIDTTTGCSSSCTPVVFHLMLSGTGEALALLQEPDRPLRKVYHEPWNEKDHDHMLSLLKKLPEGMEYLNRSQQMANEAEFPAQTWTFLKPYVVQGSAYSSRRVYEAYLKTRHFLENKHFHTAENTVKWITGFFRVQNSKEASDYLGDVQTYLGSTDKDPQVVAEIYHLLSLFLPYYAPYDNQKFKVAFAKLFENRPYFRSEACQVIRLLAQNAASAELFLNYREGARDCGSLQLEQARALEFLAQDNDIKKWIKDFSWNELPQDEVQNFENLKWLYGVFTKYQRPELAQEALLRLAIRFPASEEAKALSDERKQSEAYKQAYAEYLETLKRKLSSDIDRRPFPLPKIDKPMGKKNIIIFFANWCPHCRKTMTYLKKNLRPQTWSKILLIDIMSGPDGRQEFCDVTHLDRQECLAMARFKSERDEKDYLRKTEIFSVPRIMLLDSKGRIAQNALEIDADSSKDIDQEISLMLDSSN